MEKNSPFLIKWRGQLLLLAFMCSGMTIWADTVVCDFEVNNICYNYIGADGEVAVTFRGYKGVYNDSYSSHYSGSVTIPATVTYQGKTYRVTAVDGDAFRECYSLAAISLPSSITAIGDYSFADCSSLTSITLPLAVKTIGNGAFDGCVTLSSVYIPNGVTTIGGSAFQDCRNLNSLSIPNTVEDIGANAFSATGWWNSQPDGMVYVGKVAYKYKGTMPEGTSITLNGDTKGVAASAFYGLSNLVNISIPSSVTTVGTNAFYGTSWFNNLPDGLVYAGKVAYKYKGTMPTGTNISITSGTVAIADNAFYGCSGLTSVTIPSSVTSIRGGAFQICRGLTSVRIPNSVTSIGSSAFAYCSGLTSVTIPPSVTSIGGGAFSECSSLTAVYISDIASWCRVSFSTPSSNPLYYAGHLYLNNQELTDLVIPNGVTRIGDFIFSGCRGLISVAIPSGVTSIGDYAFDGCNGLTSVTIPNGVTSIGNCAFFGCI